MIRRLLLALGLAVALPAAAGATCSPLPYGLTEGTTAFASQVMANFNSLLNCVNDSLVTLSGPLGPIGAYVSPIYQNQGTIPTGTHNVVWTDANNVIGASQLTLIAGDQSQVIQVTVGTPQSGDIISGMASVQGAGANPYTWNYTVQGGDTATSAAAGWCTAMLNNSAFIAALAAFQPTNTYTIPIGYYPVQAGGTVAAKCASQTSAGVFSFDFPWAASVNAIAASRSGGGTTTISLTNQGLDGSPQLQLGKYIPGHNNSAGDLGPWIPFQGQINSSSTGLDAQIAAIYTRFTSSNSVKLVLQSLQSGVRVDNLALGAGAWLAGCTGATDPGVGIFEACAFNIGSVGATLNVDGSANLQLLGSGGKNVVIGTQGGAATVTVTPTAIALAGPVSSALGITNATDATSPTTGSFTTAGGVGVAKALWVGGLANVAGAFQVQGATALIGNTTVAGTLAVGSTLGVTGATTLSSTLGVTGNTTVGGTFTSTGKIFANATGAGAIEAVASNTAGSVTIRTNNSGTVSSNGTSAVFNATLSGGVSTDVTLAVQGGVSPFAQLLADTGLTGGMTISTVAGTLTLNSAGGVGTTLVQGPLNVTGVISANGTAGVSCTVNVPAHITVVNGIVTLCN